MDAPPTNEPTKGVKIGPGLPSSPTSRDTDLCISFCSIGDMEYPDREVRAFYNTECSDMTTKLVPTFASNSRDCYIAEINQYVCGCPGTSYAGASTHTKQVVLAWLPRCMAIVSAFGSIWIIADIAGNKKRRRKTFGQLMVLLSSFDLVASIAYAFTTLPTPAGDYIYGSRGTDATCTAQGCELRILHGYVCND